MQKKIYIIGIGGIGISAIARYYLNIGYEVFGSDTVNSELIEKLKSEGCKITTSPLAPLLGGEGKNFYEKIIYTEAVTQDNDEIVKAKELGFKIQTYPESLAKIANNKKLIAISGTHGKSTTTSLTSLILKNSEVGVNAVIGTILKEFGGKNAYFSNSEYFVIEACEYKRSFLRYKPLIGIITNIDLDHLDYYKDLEDYVSAFEEFINNIRPGGFAILNGEDENCKKLLNGRKDISYIEIFNKYAIFTSHHSVSPKGKEIEQKSEIITFPEINMKVPGNHILFDAKIAYICGHMIGIEESSIIKSLENYTGVWRRMEIIGETENENILMSDYGHHPTEINLTLKALKDQNPARPILTIFQPHQYSRTFELLEDFKTCFYDCDKLIIPNIYESRDSEEDKKKINTEILLENIKHHDKINGENFEKTLELIEKWNKENKFGIILLMGAGNIDNLREKIKTV